MKKYFCDNYKKEIKEGVRYELCIDIRVIRNLDDKELEKKSDKTQFCRDCYNILYNQLKRNSKR